MSILVTDFIDPNLNDLPKPVIKSGINWVVAAIFIVADLVGGGVVAMPAAYARTGLFGAAIMITICIIFASTAYQLGKTWVIMQERWMEYKQHCHKPYAEMARRAIGVKMRIIAYFIVYFTLFGITIVYVLLSSRIIHNFMESFGVKFNFCYLLVVVAICILPITFLKSPADFWFVIVVAMGSTILAVILLIVGIGLDLPSCLPEVKQPGFSALNSLLSLGTFLFAFSGHHVFPTVQHDMRDPRDFTKSVIFGFLLVALLYMPLSIFGFFVYGDSMRDSIIDSLQTMWIRYTADLAMALHCILTVIITINPINQHFEGVFNIPHEFCTKRILLRTCIMGAVLFVAVSIPDFSSVMNIFGSTTIPCTCVILPTLFSMWLMASKFDIKKQDYKKPTFKEVIQRTSKLQLAWNFIIVAITVVAAVVSAFMAVQEFATVRFTPPCYVQPFIQMKKNIFHGGEINCCGAFRNITAQSNLTVCRT